MKALYKTTLLEGLIKEEASAKRAQNTTRNPQLKAVYDKHLEVITETRTWLNSQKED